MINLNSQRFPHNYFSIYISEGLYKRLWLSMKNLGHIFSIRFCIRSITLLRGGIFNLPHFNKHISAYLENIVKKEGGYYLSVPGLIRKGREVLVHVYGWVKWDHKVKQRHNLNGNWNGNLKRKSTKAFVQGSKVSDICHTGIVLQSDKVRLPCKVSKGLLQPFCEIMQTHWLGKSSD